MDQIEEVKSKIDLVKLVSEYLPLTKAGRNFKTVCPFHSEKTPSLIVSPERQIWKCFGCGKGGNAFNFLMEMEGMEFGEALRTLAKKAGVKLVTYRPTGQEEEKDRLYEINHLASEFFHYLLVSHPVGKKALNYLLERGIKKESITLFKIGYAPGSRGSLFQFMIKKRGYRSEELVKAGLISGYGNNFRDFFRNRVIFSLKDHRGNVVGFSGRTVGTWKAGVSIGPKYMNTPEGAVYHKSELLYGLEVTKNSIKTQNQALIVEGELDLISAYQAGTKNIVAIKGSALTEAQCRLLKRFCENLVLALDTDLAGDQAARRGVKIADSFGFSLKVLRIPEGKDPDELAQKNPELWQNTVAGAIGVYDFLIESALRRYLAQDSDGKGKIGREIVPVLAEISDEIVKDHYVRLLARKLGVSENSIFRQMAKLETLTSTKSSGDLPAKSASKNTRKQTLETYLLSLSFQVGTINKTLLSDLQKKVSSPPLKRIIDFADQFLETEKEFESEKFAQVLPPELLQIFNNFYLLDLGVKHLDQDWSEREIQKTLVEIEKVDLQERLKKLGGEIAVLEREGQEKKAEEHRKEFTSLTRKLATDMKV